MILNVKKISMLEAFILNPDLEYSASQIARTCKLNQKSTQLFFDSLEEEGILKSKFEGKNRLFGWNKDNNGMVKQFILAIEHLRTIEFYKQQPLVKQIIDKICPYVNGIMVLFGSFANYSQTSKSDIDLLVIGTYLEKEVREIINLYNFDISIKHMKSFEINPLTKEVQKKHILIKNSESYITKAIPWIN